MDKQLIERIALEVAKEIYLGENQSWRKDGIINEFAHAFLARIDAERGKEAVATKLATDNPFSCFKVSLVDSEKLAALPAGTQLFLSPTIPEGMALVPPEKPLPDLMLASYHEAIGWNACREAMIAAAQGEK